MSVEPELVEPVLVPEVLDVLSSEEVWSEGLLLSSST